MANTGDYLIDLKTCPVDWARAMDGWEGLVPEAFSLYLVNRFGDAFVIAADGSVHMLDLGACNCQKVADDKDQFVDRMNENFENWLMVNATDKCVGHGMILGPGQCYAWRVPPFLQGKYAVENIYIAEISDYYETMSRIWRKTKDLPAGTMVEMKGK